MLSVNTGTEEKSDVIARFMETKFGPALLYLPVKILVLLASTGVTILGIYSIFNIGNFFDPESFTPGDFLHTTQYPSSLHG
jgi:hypothetical protein